MSTRAVYTFKANPAQSWQSDFSVYKHHDGYPSGAADFIAKAVEFACAFIAANKLYPGDLRLTTGPEAHGNLAYHYTISWDGKDLRVTCAEHGAYNTSEIFAGTLAEFTTWAQS